MSISDQEIDNIIYNAFARATWLHKFMPFSFTLSKPEIQKPTAPLNK